MICAPQGIFYGNHSTFRFHVKPDHPYTHLVVNPRASRLIWRIFLCPLLVGVCVSTSALGQAPSKNPEGFNASHGNSAERSQICRQFIDERLAVWRNRLQLEEWQISVVMIPRSGLKPKTLGGIRWDKRKKRAVISVLDPAEYRLPLREMLDDLEFTIVHELVHLELASLPRSEASRRSEEHAVNRIADALLKLDRQK